MLQPKNLRFSSRTNLIKARCVQVEKMSWEITININSNFALSNGFEIVESKVEGMFKSCRFKYGQVFELIYWYEKGPIHADFLINKKKLDLIHIANFVNNKSPKYNFPDFYWKNRTDSDSKYIKYYDSILAKELDNILDYLFKLDDKKWIEFKKYYQSENLRLTGF